MHLCVGMYSWMQVTKEACKGRQIPWSWRYRQSWVVWYGWTWVLCMSRTHLNCWASSLAPASGDLHTISLNPYDTPVSNVFPTSFHRCREQNPVSWDLTHILPYVQMLKSKLLSLGLSPRTHSSLCYLIDSHLALGYSLPFIPNAHLLLTWLRWSSLNTLEKNENMYFQDRY